MLSSSGHTNKLKQALRRKLQDSSCQPTKVPRMEESPRSRKSPGCGQRLECSAATSPLHTSQFKVTGGGVPGDFSWSAAPQVTSQVQYQVAHALPAFVGRQQSVKMSILASPQSQGSLSPPLSSSVAYQGTEQVVPQSEPKVVVPESFLTPDSSPASSPDPQTSRNSIKMKTGTVPATAAVLKDLGQLAALVQTKIPASIGPTGIKLEQNTGDCRHSGGRRELPVMDASDIETFFHFLDSDPALDAEKTKQLQTTLQEMSANLASQPVFRAAAPATLSPHIKREAEPTNQGPSPAGQQQLQAAVRKVEQTQQQQCDADFRELEELLSFFSGEMTATQLNLDSLQGSPPPKAEVEAPDVNQLLCGWTGGQVCGAGHPDRLLMPGCGLERPQEGFSPVSPSDMSGGEEDSVSEDSADRANKSVVLKAQDGKKHGCVPLSGPRPAPFNAQAPQDVPGISEEDELYQLDKLLSLMAPDNGVTLFQDSQ